MKKFFKFMLMAAIATTVSSVFTACGDDDDDNGNTSNTSNTSNGGSTQAVNPLKVFTGGLPKTIGNGKIVTNADGLVTAITGSDGESVTFEYNTTRETGTYDVVMTLKEDGDVVVCDMTLGKNGFVSHVDEVAQYEDEIETATWDFTYNSDGQLTKMVRSEGGNETTQIKYENGNIVETSTVSEEEDEPDEAVSYKIYYTSDNVKTAIENKGCVMLFDMTLGIDMDEMEYAYYAGLLGKATKNLPVRCVDTTDGYTDTFTWTLNSAGYPTQLKFGNYDDENITFTW